jgi:hypothetical protein
MAVPKPEEAKPKLFALGNAEALCPAVTLRADADLERPDA